MVRAIHRTTAGRAVAAMAATASLALVTGCHTDMWMQEKVLPLQSSTFFADGMASRPLPLGTVARNGLQQSDLMYRGIVNGKLATVFPFQITRTDLERGKKRYDIYCSPCHGFTGSGDGMVARRGFSLVTPPADYNTPRLRKMPIGHFFDVMTNGYGTMFSYASRVSAADRWRIAAYIRVLQFSQDAKLSDLKPAEQARLKAAGGAGVPEVQGAAR